MKVRYQLPPDAHARLRMLADLAAARESAALRPAAGTDAPTASATPTSETPADTPSRGNMQPIS